MRGSLFYLLIVKYLTILYCSLFERSPTKIYIPPKKKQTTKTIKQTKKQPSLWYQTTFAFTLLQHFLWAYFVVTSLEPIVIVFWQLLFNQKDLQSQVGYMAMPSRSPGNKCSHLVLCKRWDSVECDMSRSAAAFLAVSAKSAACQRHRHTVKFICFVAVSAVSDNPNEHCRHFTGRP